MSNMNMKSILLIFTLLLSTTLALPAAPNAAVDITNKYIITFSPNATKASRKKHFDWVKGARAGDKKKGVTKEWGDAFQMYSGEFDDNTVKKLRSRNEILSIEPVGIMRVNPTKLTIQPEAPWGLASISHRKPNQSGYIYKTPTRNDMWAYILDTGVNVAHADFEGRAFHGYNAVSSISMSDTMGHGTHCAGTVASKTYGVAKKANIMSVKVFDNGATTTDIVLDGFAWAVANITNTPGRAAKSVISLSLGGTKSDAFNNAISAAYKSGILVVVAAGNDNADAGLYSPSSALDALTVGAIEKSNKRASFSNYGKSVDVFAPGVIITSLGISGTTSTAVMSGTSMACPHVAGLALYLMENDKLVSPAAVTKRINELATTNVVGNPGAGSPNRLAYNGIGK